MKLNTPNLLAFFRIIVSPVIFWAILNIDSFIFLSKGKIYTDITIAIIVIIVALTDFFDGYIARKFNQTTKLGEILDPIADKIFTLSLFLALMYTGKANPWAIYLIFIREFFVTGMRIAAAKNNLSVAASKWGKIKTFFQLPTILFLILEWDIGIIFLWGTVFLTLYSGILYILGYSKKIKNI